MTSPAARAGVLGRTVAKLIDLAAVVVLVRAFPYPAGPMLGFLYSLFGDALTWRGKPSASLGKRIVGLRVVHLPSGRSPSLRVSALRNAPVGVATFFAFIPVWGWLISGLVGVPLLAVEIYLMAKMGRGQRLGDVMGDTEVIALSRSRSP
jgi:uncharacterized RDD family membrane protein YckC